MLRLATITVLATVVACGPKQSSSKTPPAPPDQPIGGIPDLAGDWTATDTDGWTYRLMIGTDGAYSQSIDRGDIGECSQKGKLVAFKDVWGQDYDPRGFGYGGEGYGGAKYGGGGTVLALALTLEDNKCNPEYAGAQLVALASNFTGGGIVLRTYQPGGAQETHEYSRVVTATGR